VIVTKSLPNMVNKWLAQIHDSLSFLVISSRQTRYTESVADFWRESAMYSHEPVTMVMVDDNIDEIFLTRRQVRNQGIVNHFVSERKPENLLNTLSDLYHSEDASNILILLDISMPRMDGFETLTRIRSSKHFRDLPVIMFSASDDKADMAEALKLGANGYLVKPFTIDSFIGALGGVPEMKYQVVR